MGTIIPWNPFIIGTNSPVMCGVNYPSNRGQLQHKRGSRAGHGPYAVM